jgi:hypothetical protein
MNRQMLIVLATECYRRYCLANREPFVEPSPTHSSSIAEGLGAHLIRLLTSAGATVAVYRYRESTRRLARLRGNLRRRPRNPTVVRVARPLYETLRRIGQSHGVSPHATAEALLRDAVARYLVVDHIGSSHRLCEDDLAILNGAMALLPGGAPSDAN